MVTITHEKTLGNQQKKCVQQACQDAWVRASFGGGDERLTAFPRESGKRVGSQYWVVTGRGGVGVGGEESVKKL